MIIIPSSRWDNELGVVMAKLNWKQIPSFQKICEWIKCKRGIHDCEYEPRSDRLGGIFAPYTCRRCGYHSDGFPCPDWSCPPPPDIKQIPRSIV